MNKLLALSRRLADLPEQKAGNTIATAGESRLTQYLKTHYAAHSKNLRSAYF
ncbi:hypothetical protein [Escherichia sp. MOD1-EC7003]|uniref:hypothetical protein n=1 Tax=Escherichia sp. MOD1-EC7003 TaxID=2093900 RepID=UPI001A7E0E1E|nr:hypothetical protein [Escherichia sp. MOD1-EC7003]